MRGSLRGMTHAEMPPIVKPLLREALGVPLIAYILGASESEVDQWLSGDRAEFGSSDQMQAIGELHNVLEFYSGKEPEMRQYNISSVLSMYLDESGTTVGHMLRMMATGVDLTSIEGCESLNDVREILAAFTRDLYPAYLLPESRPQQPMGISARHHPLRKKFESVLMVESLFRNFFTQGRSESPSRSYATSTGRSTGVQLTMLAEMLISSGWRRARISSIGTPTLERHLECVLGDFDVFSAALRNQSVDVPVSVGLTGFVLDFEDPIDLGWGVLRHVDERDRMLAPVQINGQISGGDGEVVVPYSGSAVLEMALEYRLFRLHEDEFFDEWPNALAGRDIIQQRVESLQLGGLLSQQVRGGDPIAVLQTWTYIHDPLAYGYGVSWRDPRTVRSFVPRRLSVEDGARWRELAVSVEANRTKYIAVAIKRVLRAAAERRDHSDVLVDTVIAWENLFGARSAKTITIAGALSWLLGKDYGERRDLRREFTDIYGVRSSVVHGEDVPPRELAERARRALEVSIEALRVIFTDRLDLLYECNDGDERSLRLLMGG